MRFVFNLDIKLHLWLHHGFDIVFLTLSALLSMVSSEGVVLIRGGEKLLFPEDNNINVYKREVKFYNLCSERQLQIVGSTVDARGKHDSPYGDWLRFDLRNEHTSFGYLTRIPVRHLSSGSSCLLIGDAKAENNYLSRGTAISLAPIGFGNRWTPTDLCYVFAYHSDRATTTPCSSLHIQGTYSQTVMVITNAPHYGNKYGFYIFGKNSGRYLCFNKKSKLIARFTASPRCVFEEMFSPKGALFSVLKSVYNETLSVGFNKNGKPLLGFKQSEYDKRDKNKCFYFSKRSNVLKDFMKVRHRHGPKINANKLSHYLLEQQLKRKRRWLPWRKTR